MVIGKVDPNTLRFVKIPWLPRASSSCLVISHEIPIRKHLPQLNTNELLDSYCKAVLISKPPINCDGASTMVLVSSGLVCQVAITSCYLFSFFPESIPGRWS